MHYFQFIYDKTLLIKYTTFSCNLTPSKLNDCFVVYHTAEHAKDENLLKEMKLYTILDELHDAGDSYSSYSVLTNALNNLRQQNHPIKEKEKMISNILYLFSILKCI